MSDAMPEVERALVVTPQPGDVIVIEVDADMTYEMVARLKSQGRDAFGHDVRIVVLAGAHFAGVVRDEESA